MPDIDFDKVITLLGRIASIGNFIFNILRAMRKQAANDTNNLSSSRDCNSRT